MSLRMHRPTRHVGQRPYLATNGIVDLVKEMMDVCELKSGGFFNGL